MKIYKNISSGTVQLSITYIVSNSCIKMFHSVHYNEHIQFLLPLFDKGKYIDTVKYFYFMGITKKKELPVLTKTLLHKDFHNDLNIITILL